MVGEYHLAEYYCGNSLAKISGKTFLTSLRYSSKKKIFMFLSDFKSLISKFNT